MHLEFRRGCKEDYVKVGESKVGSDYKIVRVCALLRVVTLSLQKEGSEKRYFKGALTKMHRNNGQGLLNY